jgi:hypothetical protein
VSDGALAINGALTVHCLHYPLDTANGGLFSFWASGNNAQYALYITAGNSNLVYFAEHGAGTNITHDFQIAPPLGRLNLITLTRNSGGTVVNLYMNGVLSGNSPSGVLTQPDTPASSVLDLWFANATHRYLGDLVIQNVEQTASEVLAVATQVGVV